MSTQYAEVMELISYLRYDNSSILMEVKTISKISILTKDELINIVNDSTNITDVLRKIGYTNPRAKHTRDHLKRIMDELEISTSHFSRYKDKNGDGYSKFYELDEILVENSTYSNNTHLKKRLVSSGLLKYKCDMCDNNGEWNGNPLSLQLDHINGVNNDNRIYNLRLLCPNCHSQTETFSGKNTTLKQEG